MSENRKQAAGSVARSHGLRVGFVPLTDCAPLVMAKELGLFRKYGLTVALSRDLGWATIRDKVIYGELEAAHAVVGMPVAATLGLGSIACPCLTGLILNLHGNAITLSHRLWQCGVRDAESLREEIKKSGAKKPLTFGVVYPFSSHNFLLRHWLSAAGIHPESDVRIVVVPPPQMAVNLKAGHLDGFCSGEPWNSVAVRAKAGWCAAVSAELCPGHPEKTLMVRGDFEDKRAEEHRALGAAVLEACEFCDAPENHEQIISVLSRPEYVGVSAAELRQGIQGPFDFGQGAIRAVFDFNVFHRGEANEPSADKAAWALQQFRDHRASPNPADLNPALSRRVFRADIFAEMRALRGVKPNAHQEPILAGAP